MLNTLGFSATGVNKTKLQKVIKNLNRLLKTYEVLIRSMINKFLNKIYINGLEKIKRFLNDL